MNMHLRLAGLYEDDGADRAPPDSAGLVGALCGSQSNGRFRVAQAMAISICPNDDAFGLLLLLNLVCVYSRRDGERENG